MYTEVGYIYGISNRQVNSISTVGTQDKVFVGLTEFKYKRGYDVAIRIDGGGSLGQSSTYKTLTYQYMYFRLGVNCGGGGCVCYDGFQQVPGCPEVCGDARQYVLPCDTGPNGGNGCTKDCTVDQYY